jgi:hypothetical protein
MAQATFKSVSKQQHEANVKKDARWAKMVSDFISPPVVWALMTFPIALRDADSLGTALTWAGIYIGLVCVLPVLYIVWLLYRGKIDDLHLPRREDRIKPFLVTVFGAVAAFVVLWRVKASATMDFYALATVCQLMLMAGITLLWQISIHTMSISGVVVIVGGLFSVVLALFLIPVVFLVSAARLQLKRHDPPQIVAGILVGTSSTLILLLLMSQSIS